jgi:hypothetical protein
MLSTYLTHERLRELLRALADDVTLYGLIGAAAVALFLAGRLPWRQPVLVGLLVALGVSLLLFNAQDDGLPLALVACFLLYEELRRRSAFRRAATILLVFPSWLTAAAATSLVAYAVAARGGDNMLVVDRTNLHGLAVPAGDVPIPPGEEIDQDDYVASILEAARLLAETRDGGQGVVLFDQVNPLPFMLGQPPRRGARLWLDPTFPWPTPEAMFKGANYVLIPKQPTYAAVTEEALRRYQPFLSQNFPKRQESPRWILLSRAP